MKRLVIAGWLATLAVAASLLASSQPVCAQSGCGIKPIKPITPIGCRDLVAVCRCDADGRNCHWEWECVSR